MLRNKKIFFKSCAGYTLIEILLVVSLVMVTCIALSSATIQGVKLFARIGMNGQDRQAGILMDQISRDLRSMTDYSGIPFRYENDQMVFARTSFPKTISDMGLSEISYIFDNELGVVIRKERMMATTEKEEVIASRKMVNFLQDYDLKVEGDQYRNPRVVTLTLSYSGYFGIRKMERKWLIPSSWIQ